MRVRSHREKLWEILRVQDRLEDQVWGRAETRQDSGRLGSRNHSNGFMAVRGCLVYWLVCHQLFLLSLQYLFQTQNPTRRSNWLSIGHRYAPWLFREREDENSGDFSFRIGRLTPGITLPPLYTMVYG